MEAITKASTPPLSATENVIEAPSAPLPAVGNALERSTPLSATRSDTKLFPLMDLPLEVRNKILGHLLPNKLEIAVDLAFLDEPWVTEHLRCSVLYRPRCQECYIAILRANHQLYTEGTAIIYNRAFRVMITYRGLTFLKMRYSLADNYTPSLQQCEIMSHSLSGSNQMHTFPFHKTKQIQIETWGPDFRCYLFDLRRTLIDFCEILYQQPRLQNVRVDLYDRCYEPMYRYDDEYCVDDDEPHPAQDKHHRGMVIRTEDKDSIWDEDLGDYRKADGFELWE